MAETGWPLIPREVLPAPIPVAAKAVRRPPEAPPDTGRQLSIFSAETTEPSPSDLAALLAGPGRLDRMGGTARVSVRVDAAWRVHVLVAELVSRGLVVNWRRLDQDQGRKAGVRHSESPQDREVPPRAAADPLNPGRDPDAPIDEPSSEEAPRHKPGPDRPHPADPRLAQPTAADLGPDSLSSDDLGSGRLSAGDPGPDDLSAGAPGPDGLSPDALGPDDLSPDALGPDDLSPDDPAPEDPSPDELGFDELSPDDPGLDEPTPDKSSRKASGKPDSKKLSRRSAEEPDITPESDVTPEPGAADALATGPGNQDAEPTHAGALFEVRTAYSRRLKPLAHAWPTAADQLFLSGPRLRLWVAAAGRPIDGGYALGLDPGYGPGAAEAAGAALHRAGLEAVLSDHGRDYLIMGRRRLARLAELVGERPATAPEAFWPGGPPA